MPNDLVSDTEDHQTAPCAHVSRSLISAMQD